MKLFLSHVQGPLSHRPMGSNNVTCHPTELNTPTLTLSRQAGTRLTYPRPRWLVDYRDGLNTVTCIERVLPI